VKQSKLLLACVLAGTVFLCSGCTYVGSKLPKNNLTPREQNCGVLKQNMTFGQTSDQHLIVDSANANQQAQYARSYRKSNCAQFEKKPNP
jgi:hypothetical protein